MPDFMKMGEDEVTNRNGVLVGAALLLVGLFVPLVTLPIVGGVTMFGDGTNLLAYAIAGLAVVAALAGAREIPRNAIWPGLAAAILVLGAFIGLQLRIADIKSHLSDELQGNPFAGIATKMADAVQLQWGWLVLAGGAALIIYSAIGHRRMAEQTVLQRNKADDHVPFLASVLLGLAGIGILVSQSSLFSNSEAQADASADASGDPIATSDIANDSSLDLAEAKYLAENVEVYDVSASYKDSMLDGRVPGVDFKVRNKGNRSLDTVEVTVKFYNQDGQAIAEEKYYPVIVTSYDSDPPLRPNYIWQQERGSFYTAKSVPDEWQTGRVTAAVTDIEFSPNGS